MTFNEMRDAVKEKVELPKYFYEIIMEDMGDYFINNVDFEVRPWAQCPLHGEDVPSLKYYEETNTYYCFGCRSGGDVIKLHMEYMEKCRSEKVTYRDSILFLYKYFIEGREVQISKNNNKISNEKEVMSTNVEIGRFIKYIRTLEYTLGRDKNIDNNKKHILYKHIDDLEMLVSINKINALDSLNDIKELVLETV